jgi:pyrimidine deaminase RibD-like protein
MDVIANATDIEKFTPDDGPPFEAGTYYEIQKCPHCNKFVLVHGSWHDGMDDPEDWQPNVLLPEAEDRHARQLLAQQKLDLICMRAAVDQARKCCSETGRVSPLVGAVASQGNKALSCAFRGELTPGDHAEFTLLEGKCKSETLTGATIYTTLEPCTTRNPPKLPCVERLIGRRVARVVIGMLDPDERIRGRGVLALRKANIRVDLFPPNLMAELEEMNREFIAARDRPTKFDTHSAVQAPSGESAGDGDNADTQPGAGGSADPGGAST